MSRRKIIFIIMAAAALLRFYAIGSKSLWLDEVMSVGRTQGSLRQMLDEIAKADGHPPAYYILQYATRSFPKNEAVVRLPSALAGICLVWVVYCIGRRLLGPLPGAAAAGLSAVSAFQVYYSQEARPYALAMLLAALSLWLLVRIVDRPWQGKPRAFPAAFAHYAAYTLVSALMLYTHYYLAFALLAEAAVVAVRFRAARPVVPWWLASRIAAAALFLPYLPVVLARAGNLPDVPQQPWHQVAAALPEAFVRMLTGVDLAALDLDPMFSAVLYAAAFAPPAAGAWSLRRKPGLAAALAAYVAVPAVCVVLMPWRLQIFEPKHLAFAAPVLMLAAAAALHGCAKRPLPWLMVGLLAAFNVFALTWYYDPGFQKERWPEAGAVVAENAGSYDAIVFNPPWLMYPFSHYYEGRKLIEARGLPSSDSNGRFARFWYVEELRSNVAPPDLRMSRAVQNFPAQEFNFGGDSQMQALLPGHKGTIVVRLFGRETR